MRKKTPPSSVSGPGGTVFRHDGSEANWTPRRDPARIEPGSLARPFPHTGSFQLPEAIVPCRIHPSAVDDEEDPCWWNGSIVISEIGCGGFCRLIVTGPASGQVWIEHWDSEDFLRPGPDFHDWYLNWLDARGEI